jgi:K+ transporter
MADWFQPIGIIIATLAAVIASQALISGSFMINEAMRLNFWPKVKIEYPTEVKDNYTSPLSTGYYFLVALVSFCTLRNQEIWNMPMV